MCQVFLAYPVYTVIQLFFSIETRKSQIGKSDILTAISNGEKFRIYISDVNSLFQVLTKL